MSDINNISIQHEKGQIYKHLRQSLLHRTNVKGSEITTTGVGFFLSPSGDHGIGLGWIFEG